MKTRLIGPLFLISLLAPACGDGDSTITFWNESSYAIEDIYVTEVDTFDWGPDLLGGDVLLPGESISVVVDCNTYDVKVIDETGVECELYNIDVCFDDDGWVIDDATLDTCAFGVTAPGVEAIPRHDHAPDAGKLPAERS
jgi:hypothetical protein